MFEAAELGQTVSKADYKKAAIRLRPRLLELQRRLSEAAFPVIVLLSGVDKAGKGETANLLNSWFDARRVVTRAYDTATEEEGERPEFWRYWRDLPARGHLGVFMSAWYSAPFLDAVFERATADRYNAELDRILAFERTLARDGALILKFWLHLGMEAQKRRFEALQADPLESWRVTEKDWRHWERYDRFVAAAEQLVKKTSTGRTPWTLVEGENAPYRNLRVCTTLADALEHRLDEAEAARKSSKRPRKGKQDASTTGGPTVLDRLDMTKHVTKAVYHTRLRELQGRLNVLHHRARQAQVSTILVFEGWDAAGKGGAIRRMIAALPARNYQVISIAAPTDEEAAHHYLWRFWRHLPRAGRVTVFDRSWYGRVLVERVEGFATEKEWRRAYSEINEFEEQLVDHGDVVLKFWMHITKDEQKRRFEERRTTPHKQWKLTEEDWRNRAQWEAYSGAVNEMIERTSTHTAPWVLVEGNDKRYARLRVLESVCDALERRLDPADAATDGRQADGQGADVQG